MEALVVLAAMLVAVVCGGLAALLSILAWGEVRRASERAARDRARIERAVLALVESAVGAQYGSGTGTHQGLRLVVRDDRRRGDAPVAHLPAELLTTGELLQDASHEIGQVCL